MSDLLSYPDAVSINEKYEFAFLVLLVKSKKSIYKRKFDLPLIYFISGEKKALFKVLCVDCNERGRLRKGFLLRSPGL